MTVVLGGFRCTKVRTLKFEEEDNVPYVNSQSTSNSKNKNIPILILKCMLPKSSIYILLQ